MTEIDLRFVKYLDSIEHEYGYMLQTKPYVYPGWMKLVRSMLKDIHNHVKIDNGFYDTSNTTPVLTDIKDKFCRLRVYGHNIDDETHAIIDKYEALSVETCMTCGAPGELRLIRGCEMRAIKALLYVSCDQHVYKGWEEDEQREDAED